MILTTGGMSYPGCGTTGDGYAWARHFGHTIVTPQPALVPLKLDESWTREISGITIPDAEIRVMQGSGELCRIRDSLLFTHFGISGPCVLDASRSITTADIAPRKLTVLLDLTPSISHDELKDAMKQTSGGRQVGSTIGGIVPKRIVSVVCSIAGVCGEQRLAELPRQHQTRLINAIKSMPIEVTGTMGFKRAEVTTGGVSVQSVHAKTMSSKLQEGLYFAGEILDIDGPIGGYNFQAAFSTGWLAGQSIAQRVGK